jgi:hypothetical protein
MVKFYTLYYYLRCVAAHFGFLPPHAPQVISGYGLPGVTVYYSCLLIELPLVAQPKLSLRASYVAA